jgi:hypothetical protein
MMTRFDTPECNDPPCTVRRYLWHSLNIKFTDYLPNDVFARLLLPASVHETLILSIEKMRVLVYNARQTKGVFCASILMA